MRTLSLAPQSIVAALAVGPLAVASTQAQTGPAAPPSSAASQATTLAPVTVSGFRDTQDFRTENASLGPLGDRPLIDTPFSINVIPRQLLDNQQASSYLDYFKNDPSITYGNVPVGFASLRGFSIGPDGYLFDGMPGNLGMSDGRYQLEGVERIEVLKGPSPFFFGLGSSSSVGGSLNFVPKRALDVPVRQVTFGYTSDTLFSALADLGDRFGTDRQFGYRVNLGYRNGQQAVEDSDWEHKGITLALDWRAAPGLTFAANFEYANNHLPRLQPFFALAPGIPVPTAPDARKNIAQPWDNFETKATTSYLRADWLMAQNWTLTGQAQYSTDDRPKVKEARFGFIAGADGALTLFPSEDVSKDAQTTGQLALHGKVAPGGVENQLTFAVLGQYADYRFGSNPFAPVDSNIYAPVAAPEPAATNPVDALSQKVYSSSLLATDIIKLSEQWSVLAGLRYAKIKLQNYDPSTGDPADTIRESKTSPVAAVMWKPTPASLVYLNYAEGLEQGSAASNAPGSSGRLPPISTKQYELGAKLDLSAISLTAALFDIQKPFAHPDPADPTGMTNVQSGRQQHRGMEMNATGRVTPDLAVVAGLMALDAKVTNTGDPTTEGKKPIGVPRFTSSVYGDYRIAALPGLFVNAGVYYSASVYADATNEQQVPSWTRFDIGARYETRIDGRAAALLVGIENVANRNYWSGAQTGILTVAEPLTVKVSARLAF